MFDLVIDGKPLEKFIEVVHSVFGTLYEPRKMVRLAKAEAEAERIKAFESAKTNALLANNVDQYEQLSLAERRILIKEEKRQRNIENVLQVSAQKLKSEPNVSDEPIDQDWATRFFDIAQDISNEQMQDLWGRILAGEIKQPHSYSLRTLETLRNITSEEAQLFERIAQCVLYDVSYYIFQDSFEKDPKIGYQYVDIARLMEIGLVQSGSTIVKQFYNESGNNSQHQICYGEGYVAFVEMPAELKQISFPIYPLTHVGEELYRLISPTLNHEYLEYVLHKILERNRHINKQIKARYAKLNWINYTKGQFEYDADSIKDIE